MTRRNTKKRRHTLPPHQRADKAAARPTDETIVIAMTAEEIREAEQRLIRKINRLAAAFRREQANSAEAATDAEEAHSE